jgi:hypothetical protein
MGLNVVRNPKKLRRLSRLAGAPVIKAYCRWFNNQNEVLAFTDPDTAWCINAKNESVERYTEKGVKLVAHPDFGMILRTR